MYILLLLSLLLPLSPARAEELTIPHVKVEYSGIEAGDARALAEILGAARRAYIEDFGFDMPETITLDVRVVNENAHLWTDGDSRAFLRVRSREQLDRPARTGVFIIYGLCHELGHVAMYRILKPFDWMTDRGAEQWAHYAGSMVLDRVYEWKGEEVWPWPYDYREDGVARLRRGLEAGNDREAGKWLQLEGIVGKTGFRAIFERWAKVVDDPPRRPEVLLAALVANAGEKSEALRAWWTPAAPLLLKPYATSPIPAVGIPADAFRDEPVVVALDDGVSDGKYSRDVQAHGRKFHAPEPGEWYVRAVSVYAERFGGPEPPDKKLDIALCDEEMRPIAVWQRSYTSFPEREMGWVRLEVPPTKVPPVFYIAFVFRPSESDRIYVGMDNSTKGNSVGSKPGESAKAFEKGDWMIRLELDRARQ